MSQGPGRSDIVGETLGGKYRVRALIGSGGMGSVYEVEHLVTKRVGALKLLHPRYAEHGEVVARFVREASAAARIRDPHIVESFDAGALPSGEAYIFMERLRGAPLSALIERRQRLSLLEARDIVAQAAAGLEAAHRNGIVHRDVKPENLFVCEGTLPFVKILDFGICMLSPEPGASRLTAEGAPLGTPHYMSREQVVGGEVTFKTDIYSLGVVLYECLTGELPFHADTLPALAVKISEGKHARATELVPELPPSVDALLATAMNHDPARRFASMADFRAALLAAGPSGAFTHGVEAPPQSRRRSALRLALMLALLGLAGTTALALLVRSPVEPGPRPLPSLTDGAAEGELHGSSPPTASTSASASASAERIPPETAPPSAPPTARQAPADLPPRPKPSSNVPPSRAERDGLSRENPFP